MGGAAEEAWQAPCLEAEEEARDLHAAAPATCGEEEEAAAAPAPDYSQFVRRPRRSALRKAAASAVDARAWQAAYPPPLRVPLDADGFALSFPCPAGPEDAHAATAALAFYDEYGYVVFRDAISAEACDASRAEIWSSLERDTPGVCRSDPATWDLLSSDTYGLAPAPAVFTPQLLANRQAASVVGALAAVLGCDASLGAPPRAGLLVSHDRYCFYRPTRQGALLREDHPEWRTRENLHLDLHPWAYRMAEAPPCAAALEALRFEALRDFSKETNWVRAATGPHCQGVLALADSRADGAHGDDGGTLLVPGFARAFEGWAHALGGVERHSDAAARAAAEAGDDSRPWLIPRAAGGGSFKFAPSDPLVAQAQRVALRAGSLLIWDQRTAHGARGNDSGRPRFAQFVKAFRVCHVSDARVRARAAAVARETRAAGTWESITPLGRRVFGLDWPAEDTSCTQADAS